MSSHLQHSQVCLDSVVAKAGPYEVRGDWTEIDGKKTYITGPKMADRGILYVYDIFSFQPQSLQGADILAHLSKPPCLVVMVDWFNGGAVKEEWTTSKKPEDRQLIYQFLETTASPGHVLPRVLKTLAGFKQSYPTVKKWGAVGFCWGGKLVSLAAAKGKDSRLHAAAQSSPARMEPGEAEKITIPMAILASAKEDKKIVLDYGEKLQGQKHIEIFDSQVHGWMSARGDLENASVRSEYQRGYQILADFFDKYL